MFSEGSWIHHNSAHNFFLLSWKFFHHKFVIADMVVLQHQKCVLRAFMVSNCNGSSTEILQIQNRGKLKYKYPFVIVTRFQILLQRRYSIILCGLDHVSSSLARKNSNFFLPSRQLGKWMSKEKPVMNAGQSSKVWNKNPIISLLCTTPVWKRAQSLQEEEEEDIRAQTTTESGNMTA
jgi:hypothetical protein